MKTIKFFLLLSFLLCGNTIFAQSKVGTSAVNFLGIGVGSTALGMGGAAVAYQNGPSSLYWNPGVVGLNPKTEVVFNQTNWLVGSKYNWVGATFALTDASVIGFQLANLDYGDELVTTVENPNGNGDRWDANDIYIGLSYSQALTTQFSMGGTLKYIRSQIYHEIATSYALDLGLLYVSDWKGLRLGMSVSNFGNDIHYEGKDLIVSYDSNSGTTGNNGNIGSNLKVDYWPLPIYFRVGVSMEVIEDDMNKLSIALDALRPSNNNESVNIGTEYSWSSMVFFRAGYKTLFLDNSQESYTLGFGLKYPVSNYNLKYDFSYQKFELFGNVLTNGIAIEF